MSAAQGVMTDLAGTPYGNGGGTSGTTNIPPPVLSVVPPTTATTSTIEFVDVYWFWPPSAVA